MDFDGKSFLDMFSGSGIMGLEALSRGFDTAVAIEKHPKVMQVIKNNFKNFNPVPVLLQGDSLKITQNMKEKFDVIYIDPPYYSGIYEASLDAVKNIVHNIVILEHVNEVDFSGYEILKQKKYGDKYITFLRRNTF